MNVWYVNAEAPLCQYILVLIQYPDGKNLWDPMKIGSCVVWDIYLILQYRSIARIWFFRFGIIMSPWCHKHSPKPKTDWILKHSDSITVQNLNASSCVCLYMRTKKLYIATVGIANIHINVHNMILHTSLSSCLKKRNEIHVKAMNTQWMYILNFIYAMTIATCCSS